MIHEKDDYLDSKISQRQLIKKMLIIQRNINEREIKLSKCIQDFQSLKSNMIVEFKKQDFIENFDFFDLKNYVHNMMHYFKNNIEKISHQINEIKIKSKSV